MREVLVYGHHVEQRVEEVAPGAMGRRKEEELPARRCGRNARRSVRGRLGKSWIQPSACLTPERRQLNNIEARGFVAPPSQQHGLVAVAERDAHVEEAPARALMRRGGSKDVGGAAGWREFERWQSQCHCWQSHTAYLAWRRIYWVVSSNLKLIAWASDPWFSPGDDA